MGNEAAIETLERKITEMERKGNAMVDIVNDLRREDGLPPRGPFGSGGGDGGGSRSAGGAITQIRPDTFYGKKLQTAVREYLEMRYATAGARSDPATPKEIYEAITSGGYEFEAKSTENAMVGLRALLRKRTSFFHKLPNGTYGLTPWYPDAKKPKQSTAEDEDDALDGAEEAETIIVDEKGTATPKKAAAS